MSRKHYNRKKQKYIANERIRGDEFRLVDAQGEQVGVVSRKEAFDYAKENDTDLILIAPQAKPIVVKAIDYHKYAYQEEKKEKKSRKGQRRGGTKDVQLSLYIGDHDLKRVVRKAIEFLDEGYQVRMRLRLSGRELGKKGMAKEKLQSVIDSMENVDVAVPPKVQGRNIIAVLNRSHK